jgi:Thin aggregative fimbriae synthesis protein
VIADIHVQVWFEVDTNQGATLVVPYVKSEREARLQYELKMLSSGRMGTSRISQGGVVSVPAQQPKAVSSVQVTPQAGGRCELDLILRERGEQVGEYFFDCGTRK